MNSNKKLTKPQTLRGFKDWFGEDMKLRKFVIKTFEQTFEKYGYEPLETPALEYSKFMLGQSGKEAEKQYYRFRDPGGRDVMLKYEVMIGMCRAVATNIKNLTLPYKRYQIQRCWRAENTQKGRYREFTQCDADTIGCSSMIADAEFIQMGLEIVKKLGFKKYLARINNRKILNGLRDYLNIPQNKFYGLCISIDKLPKIGYNSVKTELIEKRNIPADKTSQILDIVNPKQYQNLDNYQIIKAFQDNIGKTKKGQQGLQELKQIFDFLKTSKVPEKLYRFDPSIARGLASYTGPVWEYEVIDGNVGSIGGCGRYDNAIGKYLGQNTKIPATGGSFGIERICDIIKDRQMLNLPKTSTRILITNFSPDLQPKSVDLANQLRLKNISTLLYPEPVKLPKQLKYADKKGIPYVAIIGPDEAKNNKITLKNMKEQKQETVTLQELIKKLSG